MIFNLKNNKILLLLMFTLGFLFYYIMMSKPSEPFFGNLSDTWNLVPAQSYDYEEMHNQFDESRNVTPDFDTFDCGFGQMKPNEIPVDDFRLYERETFGQVNA